MAQQEYELGLSHIHYRLAWRDYDGRVGQATHEFQVKVAPFEDALRGALNAIPQPEGIEFQDTDGGAVHIRDCPRCAITALPIAPHDDYMRRSDGSYYLTAALGMVAQPAPQVAEPQQKQAPLPVPTHTGTGIKKKKG